MTIVGDDIVVVDDGNLVGAHSITKRVLVVCGDNLKRKLLVVKKTEPAKNIFDFCGVRWSSAGGVNMADGAVLGAEDLEKPISELMYGIPYRPDGVKPDQFSMPVCFLLRVEKAGED